MRTYETNLPAWILKCKQMRRPHARLEQQLHVLHDPVGAPDLGGILNNLFQSDVGFRGTVDCFLKCLVKLPVDPPMQLITEEQFRLICFPVSD
jgi:hypothetical protein